MKLILSSLLLLVSLLASAAPPQVSITIDDPNSYPRPYLSALERDQKILGTLRAKKLKAALFVCGQRVDDPAGVELLRRWNSAGHLIGSHSYSHFNFNSAPTDLVRFTDDFLRVEPMLAVLSQFEKIFRFPMLKEGDSKVKRDQFRKFLSDRGYRIGHVSIDASDWYISQRLEKRLELNPSADLQPYRRFFLDHILDRAAFYRDLAQKTEGREVKHTLLLHHNLLNALFLADLVDRFRSEGWEVIDASEAFKDPLYQKQPNTVPAGESILWALAKETAKYEGILRYPGEDGVYEKPAMDRLGL